MSDFKLKILCFSWIVVISSIMLYMHSWHQISFNFSESNFSKSDILNQIELAENNLIHIVAPACGCSNVVLRMLTENSRPNSKVKEFVFLIDGGDALEAELDKRGYIVKTFDSFKMNQDKETLFSAVPMLIRVNSNKDILYAGGYSNSLVSPLSKKEIQRHIASVKNSKIDNKKIKGCAVSEKYQQLLDPMGIKYAKN